jgi:hypothetical protein
MTTDAEDRSTWPRNRQIIRRDELLRLIEENGGPLCLDLRGAFMAGDEESEDLRAICIDLSPETLLPLAQQYRRANGGSHPPWLVGQGGIVLYGALLQEVRLAGARLQQAILVGAHLQGAFLVGAQLQGAALVGAQLERVDMYDVGSLDGARWHGAFLDHTRIKRESLGKAIGDEIDAREKETAKAYHDAKEAYLLLKNNFNQIGRYEDASWAYVKEQQMEKMGHYWEWRSHGWRIWRAWGSLWRWLRNWAYELATGYGERPWNPVIGGLLAILAFGSMFWATRAIGNFWDALIYSIATFATFNLARPGLNPQGPGAEVASSLEALLGIAVLALVVFTLGNKMSRG